MKFLRHLSSIALFACITPAFAAPVDVETAEKIGAKFMKNNAIDKFSNVELAYTFKLSDNSNCCYVFNIDKSGFVIVSADDLICPIIGYSNDNQFDSNDIAPGFAFFIDCFADKIEDMRKNNQSQSEKAKAQWELVAKTGDITANKIDKAVSPLIKTKWNQDRLYNDLCPKDPKGPNGRVYAGCVACAMSQIMKYWNYPPTGIGSYSYNAVGYGTQTADFGNTNYNYSVMPLSLTRTSSEEEIFEVAQLMYHCGVSVDMGYGPDGSGAMSDMVPKSWKEYFMFADDTYMDYMMMHNAERWAIKLKEELDKSHPLYYSGSNDGGGHAFVCDGYDNNGLFHFNWGWGGSGDAFFIIDETFMFPNNQGAIFNAEPKYLNSPTAPSNFEATADEDFTKVTLNWTNPSTTILGRKIEGTLDVYLLRNNDTIYNTTSEIGTEMQFIDEEIAEYGNYTYSVFANVDTLQGFAAKKTIFFGENCEIKIAMVDQWNDGWGGANISISNDKGNVISSVTLEPNSSPYEVVVQIPIGRIHFTWNQSSASGEHPEGYYDKECAFTIYDSNGNEIYDRKINNPLSNTTFLSLDLHDDCTTDNIDYYGINEHNKSIVDVYPNPANDFVTISGTENIDKIQIINNIGAIIETMECGNQKSVTVSTKNLASGMYFIVITNADKSTSSTKFIKK